MAQRVPSEAQILTSASFRRARMRAAATCESPEAMQALLAEVAGKQEPMPRLAFGTGQLHLDVICSVVEGHLDALDEVGGTSDTETSITGKARLRLAVAALHYLVDPDDVIPDSQPHGDADDLIVLRWAARMAWGELPAGF